MKFYTVYNTFKSSFFMSLYDMLFRETAVISEIGKTCVLLLEHTHLVHHRSNLYLPCHWQILMIFETKPMSFQFSSIFAFQDMTR